MASLLFDTLEQDVIQELGSIRTQIEKLNAKIETLDTKIDTKLEILDMKIGKSASDVRGELILWIGSVCILQMVLIIGLALMLAH